MGYKNLAFESFRNQIDMAIRFEPKSKVFTLSKALAKSGTRSINSSAILVLFMLDATVENIEIFETSAYVSVSI